MSEQDGGSKQLAVIGAGPAGLRAAVTAAEEGVDVCLIDSAKRPGGQYYRQLPSAFQQKAVSPHWEKARSLFARLDSPRITYWPETQVLDISQNGRKLWLHGPQAPATIEAAAVVLATGAYDRPAAFPGWTFPGVLSVGAAQAAIKGQRVLPGKRVLLAGTGPLLAATAADLLWAGAHVVGVLEGSNAYRRLPVQQWRAAWGQWARLREAARYVRTLLRAGVPYRFGWMVVEALGTAESGLSGAMIAPIDEAWRPIMKKSRMVACDTICIGYGFLPENALLRLLDVRQQFQEEAGGWVPLRDAYLQTSIPGVFAAGDGAGIGGAVQAELEGQLAGAAAAASLLGQTGRATGLLDRKTNSLIKEIERQRSFQRLYGRLFTPQPGIHTWASAETVLCRCENVSQAAVAAAVAGGAETVTAVKGLTRAGMGACQGRLCGHLIAGQIARITGKSIAGCGQLSKRAPVSPLPVAEVMRATGRS